MRKKKNQTVADLGEHALLALIQKKFSKKNVGIDIPIGDDAAVIKMPSRRAVISCDTQVENVHFKIGWSNFFDIGCKAAAVNLSDLAAMGAKPRALLLALTLRPNDLVAEILSLIQGLTSFGAHYGAPLVGGDISKTAGPLVVAVTVIGEIAREKPLRRYQGHVGDKIMVTGTLGDSALGLYLWQHQKRFQNHKYAKHFMNKHTRPTPQVRFAMALARTRYIRSATDISDGLARNALHIVRPGTGAWLDAAKLPLDPTMQTLATKLRLDSRMLALSGGEDYELVLAVPEKYTQKLLALAQKCTVRLTEVGHIIKQPGLHVSHMGTKVRLQGHDHFQKLST